MPGSVPPVQNAPSWEIHGAVEKAKVPLQYRVAMAFVAVVMVLLPLIYLAMIGALGWWWWDFASAGPGRPGRHESATWLLIAYLTPLAIGGIVIVFMVKPLFHRRQRSAEPHRLKREEEPGLFAFIDRICDLVRAPRPHRVVVDLQVNAAASLTHGIWSVLSRRLTLNIGLPLAGGLSTRGFGGVLAHEFGHFAQGAGMGATYLVRVVNLWFARVVYERDQWDAALETWAKQSDWRVMIVLQFARLMVWLVRRVLWVLMVIGTFFSSVLMRQMEFDADYYEIQTSGSEGFISTARRLRVLGLGAHVTSNKQEEAFNAKRLVDNIPGWILHETSKLPKDACEKVVSGAADEKTGWLDTHPSDGERIRRANAASCTGVLQGEAPASVLFSDFAALSRTVTAEVYRDLADAIRRKVTILPLEQMAAESDATSQGGEAMDKMFHGLLTARTLVFVRPQDVEANGADARVENLAARETPGEAQLAAGKELDEAMGRQNEMHGLMGLFEAGIPVNAGLHKLPAATASEAHLEGARAKQRLDAATAVAAPALDRARQRLVSALRWKMERAPGALRDEVQLLATTLERIEQAAPTLAAMRPLTMAMVAIFNNHEQASDNGAAFQAANRRAEQLREYNEKALQALGDIRYPFEHGGSTVKLREYLTDSVAHPDGMVLALLRADAILERLFGVYVRSMGRLALMATQAEAEMDAEVG